MKNRELKVEQLYVRYGWKERDISQIRLKGLWLQKVGFKPGDRVKVIPKTRGELVIKLIEES